MPEAISESTYFTSLSVLLKSLLVPLQYVRKEIPITSVFFSILKLIEVLLEK
jgi:hypothetical protein